MCDTVWRVPSPPSTNSDSVFVMVRSEGRGLDSFPGESLGPSPDDKRLRAVEGDVVRPKAICGFIGLALSGEAFMASTLRTLQRLKCLKSSTP
jgi:hypothetical protein